MVLWCVLDFGGSLYGVVFWLFWVVFCILWGVTFVCVFSWGFLLFTLLCVYLCFGYFGYSGFCFVWNCWFLVLVVNGVLFCGYCVIHMNGTLLVFLFCFLGVLVVFIVAYFEMFVYLFFEVCLSSLVDSARFPGLLFGSVCWAFCWLPCVWLLWLFDCG